VAWTTARLRAKCRLDPSSRLATMDMGRKLGRRLRPRFGEGRWVPIRPKFAWAEAYLHTKWHLNPFSHVATTDMGRKLGEGLCPFVEGKLGPHLTLWPGPRPTRMPSFILIRTTVWSQYTNVTERTGQIAVC